MAQLTSWSITANDEITLNFSEPVNLATFNQTAITIDSAASGASTIQRFTLTGGGELSPSTRTAQTVVLTLSAIDRAAIGGNAGLATATNNSFLHATSALVVNASGGAFTAIPESTALQAASVVAGGITVPDTTGPGVSNFLLLRGNTLQIHFNEPVDLATFDLTAIQLSAQLGETPYSLTGGTVTPSTGLATVVEVLLTDTDIDAIIAMFNTPNNVFAMDRGHTILHYLPRLVMDAAGNPAIPVPVLAGFGSGRLIRGSTSSGIAGSSVTTTAMTMAVGNAPDHRSQTRGPKRKGVKGMVKISGARKATPKR